MKSAMPLSHLVDTLTSAGRQVGSNIASIEFKINRTCFQWSVYYMACVAVMASDNASLLNYRFALLKWTYVGTATDLNSKFSNLGK